MLTKKSSIGKFEIPCLAIGSAADLKLTRPLRHTFAKREGNTFNVMKLNNLEDLLLHELKDLYSAETQLVKALPKMAKAASHQELKAAFEEHLEQTEGHVERLDEIAEMLGKKLTGLSCKAMKGLVEEGSDLMSEEAEPAVRDAALISSAQRVEHYEIAGYGTARCLAEQLGHSEIAELLEQTLGEEKQTDQHLSELATSGINAEASQE